MKRDFSCLGLVIVQNLKCYLLISNFDVRFAYKQNYLFNYSNCYSLAVYILEYVKIINFSMVRSGLDQKFANCASYQFLYQRF